MDTILHKYSGRKRLYPGYPIAKKQGGVINPADALITAIKAISTPTVLLVAGKGMEQTSGGAAASAQNDPIGRWLDQSGNNNHAVMATAGKRPLLNLSVTNGKPSALFNSTNATRLEGPFVASAAAYTCFVVYRFSFITASPRFVTSSLPGGADNGAAGCVFMWSSAATNQTCFHNAAGFISSTTTTGAFHTGNTSYNGAQAANQVDNGTTNTNADVAVLAVTVFDVGGDSLDSAGNFYDGDICFVALWNTFVSAPNQSSIFSLLKTYYGTP